MLKVIKDVSIILKVRLSLVVIYIVTLNIIAIFRLLEMTDFCMLFSTFFPLAPNNLCVTSSSSFDHPPRTSMMILCCSTTHGGHESSQNRNVRHILCSAAALINVFKMAADLDAKYAIEMIFDTSRTKMRLKLTLKRK